MTPIISPILWVLWYANVLGRQAGFICMLVLPDTDRAALDYNLLTSIVILRIFNRMVFLLGQKNDSKQGCGVEFMHGMPKQKSPQTLVQWIGLKVHGNWYDYALIADE